MEQNAGKHNPLELNPLEAFLYRLLNAPLNRYPYPHAYISEVFDPAFYQHMLSMLPKTSAYRSIAEEQNGQYPERMLIHLHKLDDYPVSDASKTFWKRFLRFFDSPYFKHFLMSYFSPFIKARFEFEKIKNWEQIPIEQYPCEMQLVRDLTNYGISPHTDHPQRLINLLFYLPKNNDFSDLGTCVYLPKDPSMTCLGGPHYVSEGFKRIHTFPYLPNSLVCFFKTANSFHGVEPIQKENVERDVLLYYLKFPMIKK